MFDIFKRKRTGKFGEIAVDKGLASPEQVEEALAMQREYSEKHNIHKEIGVILTEKGVLTPNDVAAILEEQKGRTGLMAWFAALFGLSR